MSTEHKLKLTMANLEEELELLLDELAEMRPAQAVVYHFPHPTLEDESLDELKAMSVSVIEGREAFDIAAKHYTNFLAAPGYERDDPKRPSTKFTRRLPGLLAFNSANPSAIMARIARINRLKADFFSEQKQLDQHPDIRFEKLHSFFPGLVLLELKRKISAMSKPVKSVRFNWEHRNNIKRVQSGQLVEQLESKLNDKYWQAGITSNRYLRMENIIGELRKMPPDTPIRKQRPMKAIPIMKLNMEEPLNGKKLVPLPAHSPGILLAQSEPVKVTHLKDYEPPESRHAPEGFELLDEHLGLYRPSE